MTSTLVCVESDRGFECKLISNGEVKQELVASKIKLNSRKEDKINIFVDLDRKTFIATTNDYLNCRKEGEDVIICNGKREEKISKERYGIFER